MLNAGNSAASELWTEAQCSRVEQQRGCLSQFCHFAVYYIIAHKEVVSLDEANFILRYMRMIISDLLYQRELILMRVLPAALRAGSCPICFTCSTIIIWMNQSWDWLFLIDLPGNM